MFLKVPLRLFQETTCQVSNWLPLASPFYERRYAESFSMYLMNPATIPFISVLLEVYKYSE
jgi:hypothetical protein